MPRTQNFFGYKLISPLQVFSKEYHSAEQLVEQQIKSLLDELACPLDIYDQVKKEFHQLVELTPDHHLLEAKERDAAQFFS